MDRENSRHPQRVSEDQADEALADLVEDGTAIETACFRKSRHGAYQKVLVHADFARDLERFDVLRRLLIEIPGGHIVVASRDAVQLVQDGTVDSGLGGTWFRFTRGRFEGAIGRSLGEAHEAELLPWIEDVPSDTTTC